jgi:glycine/D-amino acid oxidase-like deaminating enzyme
VIGGGLLGCAASYFLARAGARVVVLDKGQLNRQASGQNAGSLHFQLEHRMVEHGDELADQFALSIPLSLEAERSWGALEQELDADLHVHQQGGLMVAETTDDVALLERKYELERTHGLDVRLIDGDEARAIAPYLTREIRAAAFCPGEGHANPRLVGPAFARAASRLGAEIRVAARVESLRRVAGRWLVSTAHGVVSAEVVLIAAGIWTSELAAMADTRLPVLPVALTMIATAEAPPTIPHLVQHVGRRLSMKQTTEGNVLIGGGWPARLVERAGIIDLDARPELRVDSITQSSWTGMHVVPWVGTLRAVRIWTGIAAVTPDQVPLLGPVRNRPGLFVATGGAAFTLGPVYARLLSEQILGHEPFVSLAPYSPFRYAHLNVA